MATKRIDLLYKKDNGDGTTSFISGASASIRIIRTSDGYSYDSVSDTFKLSLVTNPSMTESNTQDGWFYYEADITNWSDGTYIFNATATKTGESPYEYTEVIVISSGVESNVAVVPPAPPSFCRVYVFFADKPATSPVVGVTYQFRNSSINNYPLSVAGVYNSTSGLWYADLVQGSTVNIMSITRGIYKTIFVPYISSEALISIKEVI